MLDLLEHIKSSKYYVISKQRIVNSVDFDQSFDKFGGSQETEPVYTLQITVF